MFVRRDCETWIRRQILVQRPEGRCTRLLLRHVVQGNKAGNEVASINVPEEAEDGWIQDTLNELETAAHTDAGGLGGPQKYMIFAFYERSEARPLARFPFMEQAAPLDDGNEGEELDTEAPNARGLTAQLMRHNEALMRTTMMGMGQIISTLQRHSAKQADVIEKLVNEKFENLEVMESLLSDKQKRDIEAKEAEVKQKLLTDAAEKAMSLMPIVVSKLTGKTMPSTPSMNDELLKSFLSTISPDQLDELTKVLKPEQSMIVLELYQKLMNPPPEAGQAIEKAE